MEQCPNCGVETIAGARFCHQFAQPLQQISGERISAPRLAEMSEVGVSPVAFAERQVIPHAQVNMPALGVSSPPAPAIGVQPRQRSLSRRTVLAGLVGVVAGGGLTWLAISLETQLSRRSPSYPNDGITRPTRTPLPTPTEQR